MIRRLVMRFFPWLLPVTRRVVVEPVEFNYNIRKLALELSYSQLFQDLLTAIITAECKDLYEDLSAHVRQQNTHMATATQAQIDAIQSIPGLIEKYAKTQKS